jgi:hypothetical protein
MSRLIFVFYYENNQKFFWFSEEAHSMSVLSAIQCVYTLVMMSQWYICIIKSASYHSWELLLKNLKILYEHKRNFNSKEIMLKLNQLLFAICQYT